MRIGDWSSVVCSSDLRDRNDLQGGRLGGPRRTGAGRQGRMEGRAWRPADAAQHEHRRRGKVSDAKRAAAIWAVYGAGISSTGDRRVGEEWGTTGRSQVTQEH